MIAAPAGTWRCDGCGHLRPGGDRVYQLTAPGDPCCLPEELELCADCAQKAAKAVKGSDADQGSQSS